MIFLISDGVKDKYEKSQLAGSDVFANRLLSKQFSAPRYVHCASHPILFV